MLCGAWYSIRVPWLLLVLWFWGSLLWQSMYFIREGTLVDRVVVFTVSTPDSTDLTAGLDGRWNVAAYHPPYPNAPNAPKRTYHTQARQEQGVTPKATPPKL